MMMKKLFDKFENAMTAAAFAEAGEFETAREILKEQRTVLLALTDNKPDLKSFRYAINICKRINAELEILYVSSIAKDLLNRLLSELKKEKMVSRLIENSGCIRKKILNHVSKNKGVLFVVVESPEGLNINCKKTDKIIADAWKDLKCPLVVVSDLVTA